MRQATLPVRHKSQGRSLRDLYARGPPYDWVKGRASSMDIVFGGQHGDICVTDSKEICCRLMVGGGLDAVFDVSE
jgi:hypothetical protein